VNQQQSYVYEIDPKQAVVLQNRLRAELPPEAEWRPVPYARFSVRSAGTVLTCYESGKVVVQGPGASMFAGRFLGGTGVAPVTDDRLSAELLAAQIGSDEVGKGDYFGPLVVVAVWVDPARRAQLDELGVVDSKRLGDDRVRRIAAALEPIVDQARIVLDPPEYNERYSVVKNVNRMLAELHARALQEVAARHPRVPAVVDRFGDERDLLDALADVGIAARGQRSGNHLRVHQVVQGERHPVVAAASILAREAFLTGLARCAESAASDLPKGAGENVDAAARRVVAIGGRDLLHRVAKLHFRNSQRVLPPA
jgi:ribonuclease HIII